MTADSFVCTTLKNICSLGARSARASVSDVQVAQGTIAPHKEPVATISMGSFIFSPYSSSKGGFCVEAFAVELIASSTYGSF